MNSTSFSSLALATVLALAAVSVLPPLAADEIKLKSGQVLTGRITYEADDIVKIEIPVTASIKETKILARGDIESITKEAPDSVAFKKVQVLVPTGSLVSVDAYRKLLETGPDAFLRDFPGSEHADKVKEIRTILADELDKVERGFVKIENDWYSPQDKIAYKELIDSRIRLVRMESFAQGNDMNSLIGTMREYEVIEENYFGSPAFPKAVELAKQALPNLGRQVQALAANVEFRNAEYERSLASSPSDVQEQLKTARAREDKAYADSVAADKKEGIKWTRLNPQDKKAIDDYLKLAATELARIREHDTVKLAVQAEQLVEVDKLIAANDIAGAKAKLAEATALAVQSGDAKSKSKSKSTSKSTGKGAKGAGSYIAALNAKINAKVAEEKEKEKAKQAASASEALTANLKKAESEAGDGSAPPAGEAPVEPGAEPAPQENATPPAAAEVDEFSALASPKKTPEKGKENAKEKAASKKGQSAPKTKSTPKAKSQADEGDDGDEDGVASKRRPTPDPVADDEGGFPFWLIGVIVGGIALIAVVALKVLGIGGKKGED